MGDEVNLVFLGLIKSINIKAADLLFSEVIC
jgi:hypothetical protein